VVGHSQTGSGQIHAFITGPDGLGMTDLGTLRGLSYSTSGASGINEIGQVVGTSFDGVEHAFITGPDGAGMTDLGTLGGDYSYASGINDAGQVVGSSYTHNGEYHAFITGPDGAGMTDLASLVNPPPGFTDFGYPSDINNHGQLAAVGGIPEPEMYAMLLLGLGLLGFLARGRATA
jgi:probable HAF family extracellular repeat protein